MSYLAKDNFCGSCQYWDGERTLSIDKRQALVHDSVAICKGPGTCPNKNTRKMGGANLNCKWYSKWDQLK